MIKPWKRIEPTSIKKIGWKTIVSKSFVTGEGKNVVFDTVGPEGQHHAGIVAITTDNKVIVGRQFRVGPEKIMLEIPGGTVNEGEDPQLAAEREMLEETGYKVGSIQKLGVAHKDAYMNATWHYFLALDCEKAGNQQLDDNELIDVELITINQFIYNAKNDLVTDHGAVLMAYDKLRELENESL